MKGWGVRVVRGIMDRHGRICERLDAPGLFVVLRCIMFNRYRRIWEREDGMALMLFHIRCSLARIKVLLTTFSWLGTP